jgi:hypothetical protein
MDLVKLLGTERCARFLVKPWNLSPYYSRVFIFKKMQQRVNASLFVNREDTYCHPLGNKCDQQMMLRVSLFL